MKPRMTDGPNRIGGVPLSRRHRLASELGHSRALNAAFLPPRSARPIRISGTPIACIGVLLVGVPGVTIVMQGHDEVVYRSENPSLDVEEIGTAALRNAASALQEVMLLNDPETFILESTPLSAIDRKPIKLKAGQIRRIPRSNERPTYTILKPHEICDRMGLPMPVDKRVVVPHERRSHLRTLRSEFFRPANRGKQILIPASWIGPVAM